MVFSKSSEHMEYLKIEKNIFEKFSRNYLPTERYIL
jgi:hypothetical protein